MENNFYSVEIVLKCVWVLKQKNCLVIYMVYVYNPCLVKFARLSEKI